MQSNQNAANQTLTTFFNGLTDDMQACIQSCVQCAQICELMISHCLQKGGMHSEPSHIRLLQDSADICHVAAKFMTRDSDFHSNTCQLCAEICLMCAYDCERLGDDDEMMQNCAKACRQCAESCQSMSSLQ